MINVSKSKKYIYGVVFTALIAVSAQAVYASGINPKSFKVYTSDAISTGSLLTNNIDELESGSTMNLAASLDAQDTDGKIISANIVVGENGAVMAEATKKHYRFGITL